MTEIDRFRRYEENFLNSTRIVDRSMRQLESSNGNVGTEIHSSKFKNKSLLDLVISSSVEIESELSECEGYLKAMDVESKSLPISEKRGAQQKVNDYREEHKSTLKKYGTVKFNAEAHALKGGPAARQRLLTANQKLDNSTAMLEQSRMLIAQSEQTGNVILTDLESQKETLEGAQTKVKETKEFTVDAKGILSQMSRRAIVHKIFLMITIVILLGVIIYLIYYKATGNTQPNNK